MSEKTGDTKMHVMETENNLGLMLCQKLPLVIAVSYTHLTLPTNREV